MQKIKRLFERDQFATHCGIELVEVVPGHATARMAIRPHHLNGIGTVHGGAIFTLADFTFAAACNSHGRVSVAANASVSFLRAARTGVLTATAVELAAGRKLGSYEVRITDDQGELIAAFQGLSYSKERYVTDDEDPHGYRPRDSGGGPTDGRPA